MSTNLIGQILLNQFRIDAFVASGGMGAVYRVWDFKRNVYLAMKVLHADIAEDPSVFKLFQREARVLQNLAHPNIVPFYGIYQTDEFSFLLEQFIDGVSLKTILQHQHNQVLPVLEALIYLKALCAALGYAHSEGVVHCDIKPGNVMVDQVGNIYLTDFGIARHSESTTTTIGVAGAPGYMSPEQIRGEPVTAATDVYALGITMFEMLTGHRPFKGTEGDSESSGTTASERIRYAHLYLVPPDPRSLNPTIPAAMVQVIQKALNKVPEARYPSTDNLFAAACAAAGVSPNQVPNRIYSPLQTLPPPQPKVEQTLQATFLESSIPSSQSSHLEQYSAGALQVTLLEGSKFGGQPSNLGRDLSGTPEATLLENSMSGGRTIAGRLAFPKIAVATWIILLGGLVVIILGFGFLLFRVLSGPSPSIPGVVNVSEVSPAETTNPEHMQGATHTPPDTTQSDVVFLGTAEQHTAQAQLTIAALQSTDTIQETATQQPPSIPTTTELLSPTPEQPPTIYVDKNAVCRGGPGKDYIDVRYFTSGTVLEIIGTNANKDWWLVKINDPTTRKIKCWLQVGIPQGDLSSVPYSDWTGDGYGP